MYRREQTEKESILATLKVSKIFRNVPVDTYEHLVAESILKNYKEGELLWNQGEQPTRCTTIKRGVVYIQRVNTTRSNILGLFGPHECVGLAAALNQVAYPACAISFTNEVQAVHFSVESFRKILKSSPELQGALNSVLLGFNSALREKIDILSAGSVDARIKSLLQYLAERFGDEVEENVVLLPLAITRAQIAALVDARVETVIRTMSQWQKEKMVVSGDDSIYIYKWPDV